MNGFEPMLGMFLMVLIMLWGLAYMVRGKAGVAWVNRAMWKYIARPILKLAWRAVRGLGRLTWRGTRNFWRVIIHRRIAAANRPRHP